MGMDQESCSSVYDSIVDVFASKRIVFAEEVYIHHVHSILCTITFDT